MKITKENSKKINFTKLTHSGISLIVLVITIIVIIILAAAIIISLNNNNPIMEANKARYDSDVANMQAVFTNAVAKVMAKNQATVSVSAGQINTITGGKKEVTGEVAYTLTDAQNVANSTGKIVFDKEDNTDTIFYTGKKLPIYAAGETKWYVDEEGIISLEVAGTKYGNGLVVETPEIPENTLINVYEDLAGDEEGATIGKLHIGDYVDYNPIASGVTEKTEDNGYAYVSKNDVTGLTEAVESGADKYSHLNSVSEQIFTTQENLKWRVLGIEDDNILITTEDIVVPDTVLSVGGEIGYFMYGAKAYVNGINELSNISKIYGKSELAENTTAMSLLHVNKIAGVTVTEDTITPTGIEVDSENYGDEFNIEGTKYSGWTPKEWISKNDDDIASGISDKVSSYKYDLSNGKLKVSESHVRYTLIDNSVGQKARKSSYLLSQAIGFDGSMHRADFGLSAISWDSVYSEFTTFSSDGQQIGRTLGIRPVVKLRDNVIGELLSTDETGVSNWHIELK